MAFNFGNNLEGSHIVADKNLDRKNLDVKNLDRKQGVGTASARTLARDDALSRYREGRGY